MHFASVQNTGKNTEISNPKTESGQTKVDCNKNICAPFSSSSPQRCARKTLFIHSFRFAQPVELYPSYNIIVF